MAHAHCMLDNVEEYCRAGRVTDDNMAYAHCMLDNVEEYCRAGRVTDDNMAHAHCMLDTKGYEHKLRISNTDCFPTATTVAQSCPLCCVIRPLPALFKIYPRCIL
jgi:hypothetical protein